MTDKVIGITDTGFSAGFRRLAVTAPFAGALGSVGFMFHVAERNNSIPLLTLFTIWISSPFIALILASFARRHRYVMIRLKLYVLMLVLILALVIYGARDHRRGFLQHPRRSRALTGDATRPRGGGMVRV